MVSKTEKQAVGIVDKIQSSSLVAVIITVIILLTHQPSGCGYILKF